MNQKVRVASPLKCKKEAVVLDLLVERGVAEGSAVTFRGKGEQVPGMLPGDVNVKLKQAAHAVFKRRGNDLYATVRITLKQAVLGFNVTLAHLDGHEVFVTAPLQPGTTVQKIVKPRQEIQIKGEGMPLHNTPSQRGSLYVKFRIDMPQSLNSATREWLAENLPS